MVRIRLRRQGAKKQPSYRVVVADQRSPRMGASREYRLLQPAHRPETVQIDVERARYWLSVGAQPSEAVARLLKAAGVDEKPAAVQTA